MKDTRHSILEEIEDWLSNPDAPQVLWLADVAGAGKSTVAKEVAEKWKAEGVLAGRFFFSRDAEETRTPKLFFTTIAQQGLAQLGEDVRSAVALGIRKLIDPVSATLEDQCTRIFVEPLQVIQEPSVLVLDALDECEPKTCQQLLDILLPNLPNIPHLKLFVTSRPESHIQRCLNEISLQELSLRSNKEANSKDVEHYMNQKLVKISIPHDRKVRLVEQAGGLFIWARTVCDLLENCGEDNSDFIDRVLSQKVEEMDAIYRIALEQTIGNNKPRETIKRYMNVLHVIVATFEPVTPDTVNKLLNISGSTKIIHDLRSVLECGGTDEVIRFLHPTFREFLLNQDACRQYYVDIGVAHSLIAEGCLSIMEGGLKYDLCRLYDVYNRNFYPNELEDKCATLSGALQYSCNFWAGHIIPHSGTISSSISSIIEGFLASKLLDWIYVIAAQGSIDKALTMLRKLISLESVCNLCTFMGSY
ncbi:hypothetical protein CPB86DRAFT_712903 [Serendipita vermifera]|nr:hypothetical protein CPB86DRAFT_712903 [Serendipita vermifera]